MSDAAAVGFASWLLTWLVHATLASFLALAGARLLVSAPRRRDVLWKAALVLPIATSIAVTALGGSFARAPARMNVPAVVREVSPLQLPAITATVSVEGAGVDRRAHGRVRDPLREALAAAVLLGVAAPGACAACLFAIRRRRYRRALRDRAPVSAAALGVAPPGIDFGLPALVISHSNEVGGAAAVGGREVVVAAERLLGLTPSQRIAILAHEASHVARRDPAWQLFAHAVASLLMVQPLVRAIARRLERDAELICDAAAVDRTGDPIGYVHALAHLATAHDPLAHSGTAFASEPSAIVERAERVLEARRAAPDRTGRLVVWLLVAVMLALLATAPEMSLAPDARTAVTVRIDAGAPDTDSTRLKVTLR